MSKTKKRGRPRGQKKRATDTIVVRNVPWGAIERIQERRAARGTPMTASAVVRLVLVEYDDREAANG